MAVVLVSYQLQKMVSDGLVTGFVALRHYGVPKSPGAYNLLSDKWFH